MERGMGSGVWPPIDKNHPLAVAARDVSAYSEEHAEEDGHAGFDATIKWLDLDLESGELAYLAEQRALMALAAAIFDVNVTKDVVLANRAMLAVTQLPIWLDMAPLFCALVMDGITIGWKAREIADGTDG